MCPTPSLFALSICGTLGVTWCINTALIKLLLLLQIQKSDDVLNQGDVSIAF